MNKRYSIVTSFNKRIYESESQQIVTDMKENYPDIDFYIYHENSFEKENHNQEIDFSNEVRENLHIFDLFESNVWLEDFLKTSPFKDCHKIGKPGMVPDGDNSLYWKRNAIYWFRKIAAINHCVNHVDTDYLIWLDADTIFNRKKGKDGFDDTFFNYADQFDCSVIKRPGLAIETGIIAFNLKRQGKQVMTEWLDYYLSKRAFEENIWADHHCLTKIMHRTENKKYSFGSLRHGVPIENHIYRYVRHYKAPLLQVRDKQKGI